MQNDRKQIEKYRKYKIGKRSQSVNSAPQISVFKPKPTQAPPPKILKLNNLGEREESENVLQNFNNLQFWTIIGTELKKTLLESKWLKRVDLFKISSDEDFKFMFDEILEI